jgi:peroxiredoxin (alkyl hydroperoxide reductase subunit C)
MTTTLTTATQQMISTSTAVVWMMPNDFFCETATRILKLRGIPKENVTEKNIYKHVDEFKAAVPNANTVPQVFINGQLVGGTDDVVAYFKALGIPDGAK